MTCHCKQHELDAANPWHCGDGEIHGTAKCGPYAAIAMNSPPHFHGAECLNLCDPRSRFMLNPAHPDYEEMVKEGNDQLRLKVVGR